MLQGLLRILFLEIGRILTSLAYGVQGSKAQKMLNKSRYSIGAFIWSLLLVFLMISLILGLAIKPFDLRVLIFWIGIPALYVPYFFWARSQAPILVKNACEHVGISEDKFDFWDAEEGCLVEKAEEHSIPVAPPVGEWKCSCGRTNADYVSSCVCGNSKHSQIKN